MADELTTSTPTPYECKITPRFHEAMSLLAEERERQGV